MTIFRWSSERTFALKQLKNFGLTKKHLNSCILPQAKEVVQVCSNKILSLRDEAELEIYILYL